MIFLVDTLTPADRLSIITFSDEGYRICKLYCVTENNRAAYKKRINRLTTIGGTNIIAGLDLAIKTIRDRKMVNQVTSIFLLSDGQDEGA